MVQSTASAILLRKVEYGDFDLILTLLSRESGKMAVIAKAAKKSTRRFGGILELFSILQVVVSRGKKKSLPVLQEAALKQPFFNIRSDIKKTACASYWSELILTLLEEDAPQPRHYDLLYNLLDQLDRSAAPDDILSILFQMQFLVLSGYGPVLGHCGSCQTPIGQIKDNPVQFQLERGGLLCRNCGGTSGGRLQLSPGTVKQLLWMEKSDLATASRMRFSPLAIEESLRFLEAFIPYHLGREPRSLRFLRQMR